MSADAVAYVYRHSPFSGSTFAVHQAMADSVNDQHWNQFWMSVRNVAKKARCSRRSVQSALRALEAEGWIERILSADRDPSKDDGDVRKYQFLFRDAPVVFDGRRRIEGGANSAHPKGAQPVRAGGATTSPKPKRTQDPPLTPASGGGSRKRGTNPRARGTNPRGKPADPHPPRFKPVDGDRPDPGQAASKVADIRSRKLG